jgi:hypothetical protein
MSLCHAYSVAAELWHAILLSTRSIRTLSSFRATCKWASFVASDEHLLIKLMTMQFNSGRLVGSLMALTFKHDASMAPTEHTRRMRLLLTADPTLPVRLYVDGNALPSQAQQLESDFPCIRTEPMLLSRQDRLASLPMAVEHLWFPNDNTKTDVRTCFVAATLVARRACVRRGEIRYFVASLLPPVDVPNKRVDIPYLHMFIACEFAECPPDADDEWLATCVAQAIVIYKADARLLDCYGRSIAMTAFEAGYSYDTVDRLIRECARRKIQLDWSAVNTQTGQNIMHYVCRHVARGRRGELARFVVSVEAGARQQVVGARALLLALDNAGRPPLLWCTRESFADAYNLYRDRGCLNNGTDKWIYALCKHYYEDAHWWMLANHIIDNGDMECHRQLGLFEAHIDGSSFAEFFASFADATALTSLCNLCRAYPHMITDRLIDNLHQNQHAPMDAYKQQLIEYFTCLIHD